MISLAQAKVASMIVIGAGSFIVGVAPGFFVSRVRYLQQKLFLSCTLCFGGGVLLATSILHILPETRESMPEHAELLFSSGFLLVYLIDEFVHYFWDKEEEHPPNSQRYNLWNTRNQIDHGCSQSNQMRYSSDNRSLRNIYPSNLNSSQNCSGIGQSSGWKTTTYGALQYAPSAPSQCNDEETFFSHSNNSEPCAEANASLMGLLLALTIHSILEGLAVGLQKAISEVFLLAGAVASHKFIVGFCLGLELAGANNPNKRLLLAIFVFSAGSAIGIGIGMLTLRMDKNWTNVVIPILQGLAGGTLLFVTVSEILPREKARWHKNTKRFAGILQSFSVILGFIVIYLLNNYVAT